MRNNQNHIPGWYLLKSNVDGTLSNEYCQFDLEKGRIILIDKCCLDISFIRAFPPNQKVEFLLFTLLYEEAECSMVGINNDMK